MKNVEHKIENGELTIFLNGHVDSANAAQIEEEINSILAGASAQTVTVDCENLEYISSAGLRIILRMRKEKSDLKLINVSSEVYEIFEVTGFTEMIEIQKAYRRISVDGCEVIGRGANGEVCRIDRDTVVKVYRDPDSLPDIQRERELARKAFVLGVPTAIPYDVVRVGDGYGSVFELLNARSFAKLIIDNEAPLDDVVKMYVDLLKKIHSTELKPGDMPDMKEEVLGWVDFLEPHIPRDMFEKLHALVDAVPADTHMMHGDYHIKNVMLQNDEALLIDMDTLCLGNPVFEFAAIFNAYVGYGEVDHDIIKDFLGIPFEVTSQIWDKTVEYYFDGKDADYLQSVKDKAKVIAYTRIVRRIIRRKETETPKGRATIEHAQAQLAGLLDTVDSLVF